MGYIDGGAYRCYIPETGRVFVTKDVTFIEKLYHIDPEISFNEVSGRIRDDEENKNVEVSDGNTPSTEQRLPGISGDHEDNIDDDDEELANYTQHEENDMTQGARTRAGRSNVPPKRFGFASLAFITAEAVCGNLNDEFPSNAEEAMIRTDKDKWVSAIKD